MTFRESDCLRGWGDSDASDDMRLIKFESDETSSFATNALPDRFQVVADIALPPPTNMEKISPVGFAQPILQRDDHPADAYEAFHRTSHVTMRGCFVNGEITWGSAHYRNGTSYSGMFASGVPHGFGEKRAGDSVYKGRFIKGQRHGRGALFDAINHRICLGTFENDIPQGKMICLLFSWNCKTANVTYDRSLLTFSEGRLITIEKSNDGRVEDFSGLSYDEFLCIFKQAESNVRAVVVKKRLQDEGAPEVLWKKSRRV